MRNLVLGILSAVVILTLTGTAQAAQSSFNKELDFRPGGQTIGGPGITEVEAGEFDVVWFATPEADAAVCATVVNAGTVLLQLLAGDPADNTVISFPVLPGRTKTLCHGRAAIVRLECEGDPKTPRGTKCEALWRVDEYHPVSGTDR
jgi:hypothetical protein